MVRSADLAGVSGSVSLAPKPAIAACFRSWVFESEAAGHDNPSQLRISVRPSRRPTRNPIVSQKGTWEAAFTMVICRDLPVLAAPIPSATQCCYGEVPPASKSPHVQSARHDQLNCRTAEGGEHAVHLTY